MTWQADGTWKIHEIAPVDSLTGRTPEHYKRDVVDALLLWSRRTLFAQSNWLVHYDTSRRQLRTLTADSLAGLLDGVAVAAKPAGRRNTPDVWESIPVPVVKKILADPSKYFPQLRGFNDVPYFAADGRFIDTPGWDESTELYLRWDLGPVPEVAVNDARSHDIIRRLLDFKFLSDSDKLHALGLFLLALVRPGIRGATPMHLITATEAGSGKSYFLQVFGRVLQGDDLHPSPVSTWPAEFERQLVAYLLDSPTYVFFDNLESGSVLGGHHLHIMTTTYGNARVRPIGAGVTTIDVRPIWLANGNMIQLDADMVRRHQGIRLSRREDHERAFLTPNLSEWVLQNRAEIVAVLVAFVRHWIAQGRPPAPAVLDGFEAWGNCVGGIIQAYFGDQAQAWLTERQVSAEEKAATALIAMWPAGADGSAVWQSSSAAVDIHDRLDLGLWPSPHKGGRAIQAGRWLHKTIEGRHNYGGYVFEKMNGPNTVVYRPVQVGKKGASGLRKRRAKAGADSVHVEAAPAHAAEPVSNPTVNAWNPEDYDED